MLDKVLRCPESSEILVALPDCVIRATAVFPIRHQNRNLGAQFGQLEWTCSAM